MGTLITISLTYIVILIAAFGLFYTIITDNLGDKIEGVNTNINTTSTNINGRIDETNERIERVETRIIERLDAIEGKIDNQ